MTKHFSTYSVEIKDTEVRSYIVTIHPILKKAKPNNHEKIILRLNAVTRRRRCTATH